MKNYHLSIIGLILVSNLSLLPAQDDKGELKINEKLSYELQKNGAHLFAIDLDKDQYVLLKLAQRGIDVLITTFNPAGKEIENFDSPYGKNGPEYVTIISNSAGRYKLEVKPSDESQVDGLYDLEIIKLEAKAVTKQGQVDQLFAAWDNNYTPGAAVSIVEDGEILYKECYGMSNLEYDIPITSTTIFNIASVSKQFTAFAVLLLEHDGKLQLDEDIRKYIPEVPDFGITITLRHLAHHTSGMRDQWNLLMLAGWRMDDVITKEQILKLISNQEELNFDPGEEFLYCNTGFTLLAEVVSRVSGISFARFTEERIFKPLNMNHTLFYDDYEKIVKNRAYSYYQDSTGYKKNVLSFAAVGATSLFTTVEDLSIWASNLEDPEVGDATIIKNLNSRGVLNNRDTIGYAMGQYVNKYRGLNQIGHGGSDGGYKARIARFPEHRFSVIIVSNIANFNTAAMSQKVVDIYLADDLHTEEVAQIDSGELKTEIAVDLDTLNAYVGDFELGPGVIMKISLENGDLIGQVTGQDEAKLKPFSTYEFEAVDVDARVSFHRVSSNEVNMMKLYYGGQVFSAPRTEVFDADSTALSEFEGQFYSDELDTKYEFVIKDGTLIAKHQRHSDIKLSPIKRDAFSGDAWFFRQTNFVRDETGKISGCKVSSDRARNLHFRKLGE